MAARHRAHTHRHEEAQPAEHSDRNPARQARAQMHRAKEIARYHHCEHAILASDDDEHAGLGSGYRQGEGA